MDSYFTLQSNIEATGEFVDRKSRFIAQLVHIESEDEANAFIEMVRKRHYDARHNVPAWILVDGRERQSDDGEPSRTSGMPTLEVLRGAGLKNVCCVVTRYFGGILLGAGGLCRAYTKAAKDALDAAGISKMQPWLRQQITVPYALFERAKLLIAAQEGTVEDAQYGADILITYRIPEGADERLRTALREASSGSVIPSLLEEIFCAG